MFLISHQLYHFPGFTFVKELTLEVQNVVAPPKPKSSSVKNETSSNKHDATASSSNIDSKSEKDASEGKDATEEKGASKEKDASKGEEISENESAHEQNEDGLARGRPNSSAGSGATENQSKEVQDFQIMKDIGADGSPQAKETQRFVCVCSFKYMFFFILLRLICRLKLLYRHALAVEVNFFSFSTFSLD